MKKIKLFCDPLTAAMGSVWFFLAIPFYTGTIIFATLISDKCRIDTTFDVFGVILIYIILLVLYIASIYCIPQWFANVRITKDGIIYHLPFKEKTKISYEMFKYIKIAYYQHIYTRRYFLLLSTHYIPSHNLINVNQLRNSNSLVKIKLSARRWRLLCDVLPPSITDMILNCNSKSSILFDIEKEKERERRKEKKKRKVKNKRKR